MINVNSSTDDRLTAPVYSVMHGIHIHKTASLLLAVEMLRSCFMHKREARKAKTEKKSKKHQEILHTLSNLNTEWHIV